MKVKKNTLNQGLPGRVRALASLLAATLTFAAGGFYHARAQERVWFDPALMEQGDPGQRGVDLSIFSVKDQLPAGNYPLRIRLNDSEMFTRTIPLTLDASGETHPVITPALLQELNVKTDAYPALAALAPLAPIEDIGALIPAASVRLNTHRMALEVSIPQAALRHTARGYVDPLYWDDGVPALFSNYMFNGTDTHSDVGESDSSRYLNLQNGLNIGPWRVRNYSTWNKSDDEAHWDSIYTYVQRDIKPWRSQLTLGESYSPSAIFDSVKFKGAQLASDDDMLPDSLRGFAPVIRGIANSSAEVTVRQNGYIIFRDTVAPGAFEISDLYPTSHSGDLEVTIKEADGKERRFIQPFSAVPIMQRPGQVKYSLTAGEYDPNSAEDATPTFAQGTMIYGVNNQLTLYGGAMGADTWQAAALGVGVGLDEWGSVSLDITHARSQLQNDTTSSGESYRFQYSKNIALTNTSITLAGYRYSTSGYFGFDEANHDASWFDDRYGGYYQQRSQLQISISQTLDSMGSFYLNGYQRDFWNRTDKEQNLSTGFAFSAAGATWSLSATWNKTQEQTDRQIALSVSVPLSRWLSNSWATFNVSQNQDGDTRYQSGLSGTLMDDGRLSYSLQQSYNHAGQEGDNTADSSADVNYKSRFANMSLGYYHADDSQQWNYGVSGALVVHPHGVTFSQPLGDAFALVDTNGAGDIRFKNQAGVATDWLGYAVIPWLTPYERNELSLDTTTLPAGVDADNTHMTLIPNKGALVYARFDARKGSRVLLTLRQANGQPVPFGALVTLEGIENYESMVDEGGVVYLSGVKENGMAQVKWGNHSGQHCQASVVLPERTADEGELLPLMAVCR
ncbi:fimbria/pilus outer membrane usher protein [Cronobacter sakazakii]|uniref:fimbria/pilus outer membrane usher protein n=1 Tax=Cronobacter sakazakii TaxID=28141 RepID=UPI000BE9209A|nr:fimbrial biogenesis outer membrane usher protein [Cronobacter sakazakii]TWR39043.1 fimbrial biogenesis outer membrane usher protein [Cronobacter sakazakii]